MTAIPLQPRTLRLTLPARILGRFRGGLVVELAARGAATRSARDHAVAHARREVTERLDAHRTAAAAVRLGAGL